ncbi:hypothetical protein [Alicyclobacillus macrosporangiidus]|uniref:Uncharacterized protein n=1 Tax=Alicyclobacillus macrosporangiidus TaxID=392015 RepID=A0A1I7L1H5_9BACL|nr:hypothetical protein [Alicyclobacillus macrosporangiidus]SFV03593.1 hypothetical protein SAMN05421543_1235 [Alicyclobacillus macrosporangiidus]
MREPYGYIGHFVRAVKQDAIEVWQHDGCLYAVKHHPQSRYPWRLEWARLDRPDMSDAIFTSRAELDEYVIQKGLRPQLTLGI